jgi:hypothetical protein
VYVFVCVLCIDPSICRCVHVYMYVCMDLYLDVHMYVCMDLPMELYVDVYMYVCVDLPARVIVLKASMYY